MIGNKKKENENIKPNSLEMKKLKTNFPQYFNNKGEFEIDRFKDFLKQEEVDISKEGYELEFLGKSYAKYISSLETETYISPNVKHNSKKENESSNNIYIVGDNIDALKHLLKSYSGKIKCIYIDPPYNTGSDGFVYPDNFQFNSVELSEKIGITEEESKRILDLAGKSTHSAWLTFMYPRLVLARDLLSDDGVIFISIDDNEHSNLRLICDEIFGENNLVVDGGVIVKTEGRRYGAFAKTHDYFLGYLKNGDESVLNEINIEGKTFKYYDEFGGFNIQDLRNQNANAYNSINRPNLRYPFYVNTLEPDSNNFLEVSLDYVEGWKEVYPIITNGNKSVWRWGKNENEKARTNLHNICARRGSDGVIRIFEKMRSITEKAKSIFIGTKFLTNTGTKEVDNYLGKGAFDFPKPIGLVRELLTIGTNKDSIILDFFSGSSTTADAVMQLNAEDKGKRKYIMIQIPELIEEDKPAYKLGYRTIDEVGRERIDKAAKKIKEETNANIDYGYKLYHLQSPEEKTLIHLENFEPDIKLVSDDMISIFDNKYSSGKKSILATWLNEDGYGLTATSKPYILESYEADLIEKSLYIINEGLEDDDVMTLIKRIENEELDITRIIVYVHSVRFYVLQGLRKNLKVLRNNKNVTLIERF